MAIVIQSLTPTNPTTAAGNGVTFNVSASDSLGATLTYEWQFSTDGITYSSSGLSDNTSSSYDTGSLTINQSGIYYRVVVSNGTDTINSNEYPTIGNRIVTVYQDPSIVIAIDPTVDFLPTSQTKSVGETLVLTMSATLSNADISNTTLVNNLAFQWQYSIDSGSTWNTITAGGDVSISNTNAPISASPSSYMKYSTLTIQNLTFSDNLKIFRVRVSYTGAINTPVNSPESLLYIDPVINIYRQPGVDANDTDITNCYKTSISNSGNVRVSVGALTTAGTPLTFDWQINFGDGSWTSISQLLSFYTFRLKSGTTSNSDVLEIERLIYYDNPGFRCVISGSVGEATVTSDPHYIYMTDVQVPAVVNTTTYNINEDRYGNIVDRNIYENDPIQNLIISADIDIERNTGLNGNKTFTWQRKNPGSSTWGDVTDTAPVVVTTSNSGGNYTQFPTNTPSFETIYLITPPLRNNIDNGAKYRVKIESSAIFTLNGNTKTITPYYSSEITINVYRTVYITNQPATSEQYPNGASAFSISVIPSSGSSSDISYRWQYNRTNSASGWTNVPNSSPYNGVTSDILIINPVPTTLTFRWFRCVVSIAGQLSSVTSSPAQLKLLRDSFTSVSSLNDVVAREFTNHTFSINATTSSAQPISYQWQKSTNYNTVTSVGTWNNITGQTSSSLTLLSLSQSDDAYYRVRMTSFGGVVLNSNVAKLTVQEVSIDILKNIASSIQILEGQSAAYTFVCEGASSINTEVNYQWQIKRVGDSDFGNIGAGFNNTSDNTSTYILRALDTITDNGAKIRCKLSAEDVPNDVYTTECTVTVIRRFSYYADSATKIVTIGSNLTLDLSPVFTGGTPSYMWQENGVDMNETSDVLVIPNITSAYNGRVYRCRVTLAGCTQHRYSRNNTITTVNVTPPSEFTVSITINTVGVPSEPVYYSNETAKTGAAIGTVICIPKPNGYVEDASATTDDIARWACARTGSVNNPWNPTGSTSSLASQNSSNYNLNKPSWVTNPSYTSPQWVIDADRFPGYIEMRGQYLRAAEFPELARQWGTKFGGTITGSYPNYNSTDTFRMPLTYGKRLLGTGNVNNNSGSVSIVPLYAPNGLSGGDKNVAGSMGGQYNYERSAQLPPGSPGVAGQPDGTAGITTAATFSIGSYTTTGMEEVNAFVQPSFSGTVTYRVDDTNGAFTDVPTHSHTAVSAAWRQTAGISDRECNVGYGPLNGNGNGQFRFTSPAGGSLLPSIPTVGDAHDHGIEDQGPGTFDMVTDAGMNISDTTLRFTGANASIMNNNLSFFLRNNEQIPLNAPYFRLKYMIKAY